MRATIKNFILKFVNWKIVISYKIWKKKKEKRFFKVIGDNQNISKEFDWKPTISFERGISGNSEFERDVI